MDKKIVFPIIIASAFVFMFMPEKTSASDFLVDSNDILQTYDEMIGYIKGRNYNKEKFKITRVDEHLIPAWNISQGVMNTKYNENHNFVTGNNEKVYFTGTCSEVAVTMIGKFYTSETNTVSSPGNKKYNCYPGDYEQF